MLNQTDRFNPTIDVIDWLLAQGVSVAHVKAWLENKNIEQTHHVNEKGVDNPKFTYRMEIIHSDQEEVSGRRTVRCGRFIMTGLIRRMRRRKLVRQPFPEPWEEILERQVPFVKHLCGGNRRRFIELLKIFVQEKYFIGAGGMQVTDEVRVVISACAVRLVRSLGLSYYDRLTEIIVYPYTFTHSDQDVGLLGEAQDWGTVVLSWPAVIDGLSHPQSGHHAVAIHEFAHILDRTDGVFDGTPRLKARSDYRPWALVMSRHFLNLRNRARVESIVLRTYGAFNEAEFFAVATEAFFNTPRVMKRLIPDLYTELRKFYRLDPAAEASTECDAPDTTLS